MFLISCWNKNENFSENLKYNYYLVTKKYIF